jgi:hypothetical protein
MTRAGFRSPMRHLPDHERDISSRQLGTQCDGSLPRSARESQNRLKWTEPDHLRPLTKPGSNKPTLCRRSTKPVLRDSCRALDSVRQTLRHSPARGCAGACGRASREHFPSASSRADHPLAHDGPAALCTADVMMDTIEELFTGGVRLEGRSSSKAATGSRCAEGTATSGRYLPPPEGLD